MTNIFKMNGIHHTPEIVENTRRALHNSLRMGNTDERRENQVDYLLTNCERMYPSAYSSRDLWIHRFDPRIYIGSAGDRLQIAKTFLQDRIFPKKYMELTYQPPKNGIQNLPQQVVGDGDLPFYWRKPLDMKSIGAGKVEQIPISEGITVRIPSANHPSIDQTITFAERGTLTSCFAFHFGSALAPVVDPSREQVVSCATMAAICCRAMTGHLDASLASLHIPENRTEFKKAINFAYSPSWYKPLEDARNLLLGRAQTEHIAAASMTSVLWHTDRLFLIQSGRNSALVTGNKSIEFRSSPMKIVSEHLWRKVAELNYKPMIAQCLISANTFSGLFSVDYENSIKAHHTEISLFGDHERLLILGNLDFFSLIPDEEILEAVQHDNLETISVDLTSRLRARDATSEISVTVLRLAQKFYEGGGA